MKLKIYIKAFFKVMKEALIVGAFFVITVLGIISAGLLAESSEWFDTLLHVLVLILVAIFIPVFVIFVGNGVYQTAKKVRREYEYERDKLDL